MASYRIQVEAVFVNIPGIGQRSGFFTSLFIKANGGDEIVQKASRIIRTRMRAANIESFNRGFRSSYFVVSDIGVITDDEFEFDEETGSGFASFTIGKMESLSLIARHLLIRTFKEWAILPV